MAWVEKGSKGYRGRYRDALGETRDVRDATGRIIYVPSKRRARELALDEEAKIRAGTWWDPTAGPSPSPTTSSSIGSGTRWSRSKRSPTMSSSTTARSGG